MRFPSASSICTLSLVAPVAVNALLSPDQFFAGNAYSGWLESTGYKYESSLFVNTTTAGSSDVGGPNGMGLFWTIDRTDETIQLAVVCPSGVEGEGWCGFGIAEAGGMLGSDMVLYETDNPDELTDAYVLDNPAAGPIRDSCQNWVMINSVAEDGIILFETKRALDTGDTFDRVLMDDNNTMIPPSRIIGAWGDTSRVSYHGTNVARTSMRFFATGELADDVTSFQRSMESTSEGSIELRATNYPVPVTETYYARFCFTYADLIALGLPENADLHAIGIEPLVDDDATEFVHHFVVSATVDPLENYTSPIPEETCRELPIVEMSYVWAPGEGPFTFPDHIGGPLGSNGHKSYSMEIHYNNPELKTGVLDSSGIRIHWTTKKREYDMGILQLGDPFVSLNGQLVGNGGSHHTFECPGSCSELSIPEESGVTVIREYLHMHKTGQRMYNEQIRDGQVIHKAAIDFWDFDQQGDAAVQQGSFQIKPGDSFRTRCYFHSDDEVWGLGSQQEMCIAFLFYYPRQVLDLGDGAPFPYMCGINFDFFEECNSSYVNGTVTSVPSVTARSSNSNSTSGNFTPLELKDYERSFGSPRSGVCEEPPADNLGSPSRNNTNSTNDRDDEASSAVGIPFGSRTFLYATAMFAIMSI